jgi:hypothetical protein
MTAFLVSGSIVTADGQLPPTAFLIGHSTSSPRFGSVALKIGHSLSCARILAFLFGKLGKNVEALRYFGIVGALKENSKCSEVLRLRYLFSTVKRVIHGKPRLLSYAPARQDKRLAQSLCIRFEAYFTG